MLPHSNLEKFNGLREPVAANQLRSLGLELLHCLGKSNAFSKKQQKTREPGHNAHDGKKTLHTTILVHGGTGTKILIRRARIKGKPRGFWDNHPRMNKYKGEFPNELRVEILLVA